MKRSTLGLIILVLAGAVPFLNKPVHVDDTFVLRIAAQALKHPGDPYGFDIDWFGYLTPAAKATTNPPFISYWLAPFAAASGFNEVILHLAMVPFLLLWAWAGFSLFRRFSGEPWRPALILVFSAPFLVSGNLMRDVPAAALITAGLWLWLDEGAGRGLRTLGGVLLGLAVLTKYSVAVLLGVWVLRVLWRRRWDELARLWVPITIVAAWCGFTWLVYGIPHPLYLLLERTSSPGIGWQDKLFGGLIILGSSIWLTPLLLAQSVVQRRWRELTLALAAAVGAGAWGHSFYQQPLDWEFQLWLGLGTALLVYSLLSVSETSHRQSFLASRSGDRHDRFFWAAWLLAPLLFSVFFVPFQAVRHLMPALVPLLLLLSGRIREAAAGGWQRSVLTTLILGQGAVAIAVQAADYEYADSYRTFAAEVATEADSSQVWFVGHWGWKFYAERSGFRQMHRDGPYPKPGDLLLWPQKVHIGQAFSGNQELRDGLELVRSQDYPGRIPLRTMSMDAKAGFYAVIRQRIPYRFNADSPLEVMRVYRIGSQEPRTDGVDGTDQ